MDAKIGQFFDSVGSFFNGGDNIPWCDRDIIAGCEREVADAAEKTKNESLIRLSWALVHSKQPEDVNRGITMLEAYLDSGSSPLQLREKFYILAVGHYRSGDYPRSRQLLERCLEIAPEWRQAMTLKKVVEDRIAKDGAIGIGIAATVVGLLVGGIAALVARKRYQSIRLNIPAKQRIQVTEAQECTKWSSPPLKGEPSDLGGLHLILLARAFQLITQKQAFRLIAQQQKVVWLLTKTTMKTRHNSLSNAQLCKPALEAANPLEMVGV